MMFRILGPIECTVAGKPVDIGGEKPQTILLALILAEGKMITTDRLIDLVWADTPPAKPNVTLRSYISHLRKLLEPDRASGAKPQILVTRAGGYAMEVPTEDVDARLFQQLANQVRQSASLDHVQTIKAATAALELWRSVDLDDGPIATFRTEGDVLTDLRSEVQELRLRSLVAAGRHQEVIAEARPLIATDRYREPYHEVLILALYLTGRTAEALAEYQTVRSLLAEELGLEPGPALQKLESQILSNDQALLDQHSPSSKQLDGSDQGERWPGLVGREQEIRRLGNLLKLNDSRHPLGALTGEPGIGKTALANSMVEDAKQMGYVTAWGRCRQGGQADTHRPWTTILRDLLEPLDSTDRQHVLGPRAIDLATLLPTQNKQALGQEGGPVADPMALYDAVSQALRRLSESRPVLLVFEDLHWADIESLRLLRYAATAITGHRIRILATWRTTEAIPSDLQMELADLGRLAGATRLALTGLDSESVGRLYHQIHGKASPAEFNTELRQRTDGNPLFVTELLRASPADAAVSEVPTIGEAIDRRILDLQAGSKELLTIGALCPAGFTETLLAKVSDEPADLVLDRIEEAMAARILEEHPEFPDRFRFTHALIAEQLIAGASTPRCSILHARIGVALSETTDSNAQLAFHFLAGAATGSAEQGATYALRAGLDSTRLLDHHNASSLFEQGLAALADHLPLQERGGDAITVLQIDLLTALAQSLKHFQQYQRAQDLAREGFALACSVNDTNRMSIAALTYAGRGQTADQALIRESLGYWNRPDVAREMLSQCLDVLDKTDPQRIDVLVSFTSNCFDLPESEEVLTLVDEGIADAIASGSDVLLLDTLVNKVETLQRQLSLSQRQDLFDQAIILTRKTGGLGLEIGTRASGLVLALDQRDLAKVDEQISEVTKLGQSTGHPIVQMGAESMAVSLAIFQGRFDEADDRLQSAMASYSQFGDAMLDSLGIQLAMLHRERGQATDVVSMLEWKLSGYPSPAFALPLALSLVHAGRADDAKAMINEYVSVSPLPAGEGVVQFVTLATYAELVAHFENVEAAHQLSIMLAPAEHRLVAMVYGSVLMGSGSLALGRLATLLGNFERAELLLNQAQELHRALKAKPYELRTMGVMAVLAASLGNESETGRHIESAAVLADELGMSWMMPFIEQRAEQASRG